VKVLVTGGAGFIGSHTVDALLADGHEVTVLDDLSSGERKNVASSARFVRGDVCDSGSVDSAVAGQDAVIHLAAYTSVPGSFEDFQRCFATNVHGTLGLLESVVRHRVRRFVFASSSAVYAELPDSPKKETDCPGPSSPYAVSKLEVEHLLEWHRQRHDISYMAFRYFNVYGPHQSASSDYASVIPAFVKAASAGRPLTIYGDGNQTRDFVYVGDVARANLMAVKRAESGVVNIGTGVPCSIRELAEHILALNHSKGPIRYSDRRPGDVISCTADTARAWHRLGWRAGTSLQDGLKATFSWFVRTSKGSLETVR
jgi:UDP-glucose 4-epimerase